MSLYFLICSWCLVILFHGIVVQSQAILDVDVTNSVPHNLNLNLNSEKDEEPKPKRVRLRAMQVHKGRKSKMRPVELLPQFPFSTPIPSSTVFVPPPILSLETETPRIQCTEKKSSKQGEGQVMATEMCPAKIKHMIGKSVTDLRCQPRPEIVKLQLPGPNFDLHPSVAEVKRCNGFCGTPTSCLPTKISIKQVPVFTIDKARLHMFAQECAMVELEEHEECRCTCAIKASHCGPNQKYERGNCACVCVNHEEREACERNSGRQWDPNTCNCRCVQESTECASGLMWVDSLCSFQLTPPLLPSTQAAPLLNATLASTPRNTTTTLPPKLPLKRALKKN